jgi:hypothetical protein
MKNILLHLFILLALSNQSLGQKESFEDISNNLLCNAYNYQEVDSATLAFLKQHFPYLAKRRLDAEISKPPIGKNSRHYITTMTFKKHPFFSFRLKESSLNFNTVESAGVVFETGAYVILVFENEKDASKAFEELTNRYKIVSDTNSITVQNNQTIARFKGSGRYVKVRKAELKLTVNKDSKSYVLEFNPWYID